MSLLLLEGELLVGLAVGAAETSSWKIVKSLGLLLRGACEVVMELAIFGVGGKASHSEGDLTSWGAQGE